MNALDKRLKVSAGQIGPPNAAPEQDISAYAKALRLTHKSYVSRCVPWNKQKLQLTITETKRLPFVQKAIRRSILIVWEAPNGRVADHCPQRSRIYFVD